MRWATTATAIEAAAASLLLLVSPAMFGRLILGAELSEPGTALGRLGGVVLLCLALTAWPAPAGRSVARAMLAYNMLLMIYLCYLGIAGNSAGPLLWPAAILHLVLAALLVAAGRAPGQEK